jgi:uncharacterized protein (TIGR03437 family)
MLELARLADIFTVRQLARNLWIGFLFLGLQTIGLGQSVALSIGSGSSTAGGTVSLPITLSSSDGALTAGLQWSFVYSSDITSVTVVAGPAAINAGKSITCSANTCLLLGFNNTAMADGAVATATFQIASSPSTTSIPVQVSSVVASSAAGDSIPASGGSGTISLPPPAPGVHVSLSPLSATLAASQTTQFAATVTGNANTSVTWSFSPSVGTLSNGLYTAPASISTAQSITITATSVADSSKSASATVQLVPAGTVTVSVSPLTANLTASQSKQFTAVVTGNANTSVTWSMNPSVGTLSNGLYTAPSVINTAQSVTITATSVADSSKSASATVQLAASAPVGISLSPLTATLTASQSKLFTAIVTGNANTSVTWSMTPSVGSLLNGLYTAPSAINALQAVTITATSVADVSKSASATIQLNPTTGGVNIVVSPANATLTASQSKQFIAVVMGGSSTSLTWSMTPSVGSLSNGLYTAPAVINTTQLVTLTASSVSDATKYGTATVQLMASGGPPIGAVTITSPTSQPIYTSAQTIVSLAGTAPANTAQVVWATDEGIQGQATGTTSWAADGIKLRNGSNRITVTARDAAGNPSNAAITVVYSAPTIVTTSLPNAQLGQAYSSKLAALGGTPPYTWSAVSAPAGLTVSKDGLLTGNPSSAGTFTFNISVQDSLQVVANAAVKLQVDNGLVVLSAASMKPGPVAPASMVTLFGGQLATGEQSATAEPLPTTLGDCTITITDANGVPRAAGLYYVSPNQINFTVPADTAVGTATMTVTSGGQTRTLGNLEITTTAPGLFFLNSDSLAAASLTRVSGDKTSYEEVAQLDSTTNLFVAVPIDLGPDTDLVYLTLYGTGVRNRSSLSSVQVLIAGVPGQVDYAGPSTTSDGLDLVRVLIPKSLRAAGMVNLVVSVNGVSSNGVRILIK